MATQHKVLPMHKPCDCPRCMKVPTANARWGYDEAAVPQTLCLVCGNPIGDAAYLVDFSLVRFGRMRFAHESCRVKKGAG